MKRNGFTLLEIMVAVVIIGVLGSIAYPAYSYYIKRSREAEATTALGDIRTAQLMYKQDIRLGNGSFADDLGALGWELPTTHSNVGKPPAQYVYGTNNSYSSAVATDVNAVNHPTMYLQHVLTGGGSPIQFSAP